MRANARLFAVSAVLVGLAAVLWWPSSDDVAPVTPGVGVEDEGERADALRGEAAGEPGEPETGPHERRQIETTTVAPASNADVTTGSLLLRVVYAEDGTAAANLGGFVRERGVRKRKPYRTDDSGEAIIEGLRAGRIVAVTDISRMNAARTTIVAGQQVELVIELKDGVDINGIVVDRSDAPVPGATVILAEWAASEPRVICETDAGGRFFLRQASRMCNVAARAAGHAPSPCTSVTAGKGAKLDVRIVLPGVGGSVHGRVLGPDGEPVQDAVVDVGVQPPFGRIITLEDGSKGMHPPRCQVHTDAEGRFEADGIATGDAPVDARADGLAPWSGSVEVVARSVSPLVIRLTDGVVCEGTVTGDDGEPLAGVTVEHGEWGTASRRETETAEDGSYRLEGLPAGPITVKVRSGNRGNTSKEIRGRPGDTVRWDVTLSRGLVLTGVVRDEAGQPIEKVMIEAMGPFVKGGDTWFRHETTDEKGAFELVDCPAGPVIRLTLRHQHYEKLERLTVDAGSGPLDLTMKYVGEATGRIVGTVLDAAGKPVGDAQIVASGPAGGGFVYTTTAEGRIDIDKQREGTYWLRIRSGTYAEHVTAAFDLAAGGTADLGTIHLTRGGRVRVAWKHPPESDDEKLYVSISRSGQYLTNVRQGELVSDAVTAGSYELRVTGPRVIPVAMPFTVVDGQDVELSVDLRFGLPRTIEFELPSGADDVRRIDFTVTGPEGFRFVQTRRRYRATPFRYEIGLAAGRYRVTVRSDHDHTGSAEFEVSDGGPESFRVALR